MLKAWCGIWCDSFNLDRKILGFWPVGATCIMLLRMCRHEFYCLCLQSNVMKMDTTVYIITRMRTSAFVCLLVRGAWSCCVQILVILPECRRPSMQDLLACVCLLASFHSTEYLATKIPLHRAWLVIFSPWMTVGMLAKSLVFSVCVCRAQSTICTGEASGIVVCLWSCIPVLSCSVLFCSVVCLFVCDLVLLFCPQSMMPL